MAINCAAHSNAAARNNSCRSDDPILHILHSLPRSKFDQDIRRDFSKGVIIICQGTHVHPVPEFRFCVQVSHGDLVAKGPGVRASSASVVQHRVLFLRTVVSVAVGPGWKIVCVVRGVGDALLQTNLEEHRLEARRLGWCGLRDPV